MANGPVIVPLDGSKNAENALPLAGSIAKLLEAPIRIVRVADPDESGRIKDLGKANTAFADYALGLVGESGLDASRCSAHLLSGAPAATILADADENGAQAIVLASHGRGGFRAAIMGSVADKIVRGATVPVLVVPGVGGPARAITNVLVPLDGSSDSERALPLAREIAASANASLTLLQAFNVVPPHAAAFEYYVPENVESTEEAAKDYLKSIAREGERAVVSQGDAATAVVNAADSLDADLVVMAASGKGLAGRLFLGSTTDRVLHSLHRPLLIVRPPAEG